METPLQIIKKMRETIMKHQQANGFETVFDFLNEDLDNLKKACSTPDVSKHDTYTDLRIIGLTSDQCVEVGKYIKNLNNCDIIFERAAKLAEEEIEEDCRNMPN